MENVITELERVKAENATLVTERDALKASHEQSQKTVESLTVERDAFKATAEKATADAEAIKADLGGKLDAESKAHENTKELLGVAKQALKNPAFAAAARVALGAATAEGAPAKPEAAEGEPTTAKEAHQMYNAIDSRDGRAREAFRNKHKELLGLK